MENQSCSEVNSVNGVVRSRFSQFATNGALQVKTSWEAKMEKRRKLQRTKELEKNMTEARIEAKRVCDFNSYLLVEAQTGDRGQKSQTRAERVEVHEGPDCTSFRSAFIL